MNASSPTPLYRQFANLYDQFYMHKDYAGEAEFLKQILSKRSVKTVLDAGCGTGSHMALLESQGFQCTGIDINEEMLKRAQAKVQGPLHVANMTDFALDSQFDAIVSMFSVFNHNLTVEDALKTLICFKDHLKPDGILVIDLYNPQKGGEKRETAGGVEKIMSWGLPQSDSICQTKLTFISGDQKVESDFPLKIFSINLLKEILASLDWENPSFYADYTFQKGTAQSKNLILVT